LCSITDYKRNTLVQITNYVLQVTDFETGSEKLNALKEDFGFSEIMYVATCNRVMYFFYTDKELDKNFSFRFFQKINPDLTANDLFLWRCRAQ